MSAERSTALVPPGPVVTRLDRAPEGEANDDEAESARCYGPPFADGAMWRRRGIPWGRIVASFPAVLAW